MILWNVGKILNSVKMDVFVVLNVQLRVWSVEKIVRFFLDFLDEINGDVIDDVVMMVKSVEEFVDSFKFGI